MTLAAIIAEFRLNEVWLSREINHEEQSLCSTNFQYEKSIGELMSIGYGWRLLLGERWCLKISPISWLFFFWYLDSGSRSKRAAVSNRYQRRQSASVTKLGVASLDTGDRAVFVHNYNHMLSVDSGKNRMYMDTYPSESSSQIVKVL